MLRYLLRRVLIMIPTLFVTSALIFTVMSSAPTNYFDNLVEEMQSQGEKVDQARIDFMKHEYGFDKPPVERYFWWVGGLDTRRLRLLLRISTSRCDRSWATGCG